MADDRDELSRRRGTSGPTPVGPWSAADHVPSGQRDADPAGSVEHDASAPDVLDLRAAERDVAARERDRAAEARLRAQEGSNPVSDRELLERDRLLAARDRLAAALDRKEAALDRLRAAEYLRQTYRDALSGALQRDAGREELGQEVDRAHRSHESLVIAFLDVDGMKGVNDTRGHAAGDALLRAVGETLRTCLRSYDVVVRYGGDEFVCALPNTGRSDAEVRFAHVIETLAEASPGARVSVGFAELGDDESLDEVIARADRGLYEQRKLRRAPRSARKNAAPSTVTLPPAQRRPRPTG